MSGRLQQFLLTARSEGFNVALRRTAGFVRRRMLAPSILKTDVIQHYNAILGEELGFGLKLTPENLPTNSMTWLVPDFTASSGGHINILRMMRHLKERGYPNQHVVVMEPHRWNSQAEAQAALSDAFGDHGITLSLGARTIEPSHFLVATGWQTAYWVAKYRDCLERLYFVQDFEPDFYPKSTDYYLAENTYRLGLTGITAGTWLSEKLSKEYGMTTFPFSFAYDTELYRPYPKEKNPVRHIFFYARPVTPRRCFELGLLALEKVCSQEPDTAVIFAGWDVSGYRIPFKHLNAGSLPLQELPKLYSQCDAALVLSSTNLSLLPLEIAACGCPLVINRGRNCEWLLSEDEAIYCDLEIDSIADALLTLLRNPEMADRLSQAATKRTNVTTWEKEADQVAGFLSSMQTGASEISAGKPVSRPSRQNRKSK